MKAPEKIYLDDSMATDTAGELWSDALWFDTKVSDDSIEYTQTDVLKQEWKPSEEQLNALYDAAVYVDKSMFPYPKGTLMKLYKQLKKLRGE